MTDEKNQLEPIKPVEGEIVEYQKKEPTEQENDYAYARENFYNVIEKGATALEEILEVAKESEHPRAYEVVATIMKTIVDANKDLVDIGKQKKEIEEKANTSHEEKKTINNNMFVGSTAELQQLLKEMRSQDE